MFTIFDKKGNYDLSLIRFIIDAGELGYSFEEIMNRLEPSFLSPEDQLNIATAILQDGNILHRAYEHGKRNADFERLKMISANDFDTNMAEKIAIDIKKEDKLKIKIQELFGL